MGFLGPMLILILGSKKILISDISADILEYYECGYQVRMAKIRNRGRISDKTLLQTPAH